MLLPCSGSGNRRGDILGLLLKGLAAWVCLTVFCAAQDNGNGEDLQDLSLEELFLIKITTPSKIEESLWEAPAVATVVTSAEIERFGGKNLWELLERVPGAQPMHSTVFFQNLIPFRGDKDTSNNHVLVLINGRPVKGSFDGDTDFALWATFPLEIIDRIEIVRGPGSVLYGTNAFMGVINIITKSGQERQFRAKISAGSFSSKEVQLSAGFSAGDLKLNLGLTRFEEDGWRFETLDNEGQPLNDRVFEDNFGLVLSLDYKDFSALFHYGDSRQWTWNTPTLTQFKSSLDNERYYLNLGYAKELSDRWKLQLDGSYFANQLTLPLDENDPSSILRQNPDDYLFEATFRGEIGSKVNLLFGTTYSYLSGESPPPFSLLEDYSFVWWSAYGQVEYRPNSLVKFIAGAQYNKPDDVGGDVVPRLGAIFQFTPFWGMKLLYGKAFRSPYAAETRIDLHPFLVGNAGLSPEKVASSDLQVFANSERFSLALTFYRAVQSDLVTRTPPAPGQPTTLVNKGELDLQGLEFESKFIPNSRWYLLGALTYQENEDEFGVDDFTLAPNLAVKVGVSYDQGLFSLSLFDAYFSAFEDNRIRNPNRLRLNPDADAYHSVSGNFSIRLPSPWRSLRKLALEVYGTNLLDEDIYVPEINDNVLNTIPGGAERALYAVIRVDY